MSCIIGIDPGMTGAVAVLTSRGTLAGLIDTATEKVKKGRGKRTIYKVPHMARLLSRIRSRMGGECRVVIEKQGPQPISGVVASFGIGMGYGLWLGIIAALGMPVVTVAPQTWK